MRYLPLLLLMFPVQINAADWFNWPSNPVIGDATNHRRGPSEIIELGGVYYQYYNNKKWLGRLDTVAKLWRWTGRVIKALRKTVPVIFLAFLMACSVTVHKTTLVNIECDDVTVGGQKYEP